MQIDWDNDVTLWYFSLSFKHFWFVFIHLIFWVLSAAISKIMKKIRVTKKRDRLKERRNKKVYFQCMYVLSSFVSIFIHSMNTFSRKFKNEYITQKYLNTHTHLCENILQYQAKCLTFWLYCKFIVQYVRSNLYSSAWRFIWPFCCNKQIALADISAMFINFHKSFWLHEL